MIENQELEHISCTKLLILKKVLIRASVLLVIVLSRMKFYMNMNGWMHKKLKLRCTHCHLEGKKCIFKIKLEGNDIYTAFELRHNCSILNVTELVYKDT